MDEASKLVSELQHKLAELDHKVLQYRRDMASQFTKYAEDLLRDVPTDISETVSRTIAASMKDYKDLGLDPAAPGSAESYRIATGTGTGTTDNTDTTDTTAPTPFQTQNGHAAQRSPATPNSPFQIGFARQDPEMESADPHAREKEFQGLFTPSYLPLLDSTDRNERRSSGDTVVVLEGDHGQRNGADIIQIDAGTSTSRSLLSSPQLDRLPPRRRNTDELSIASDLSDGVARRSALRRSSSSSAKHSPRRVRFEVAGEEVLPTSSPSPSEPVIVTDIPLIAQTGDDSDAGDSGAGGDEEPPPRRISSSQALRNLSRSPLLDDGTQWTTVSAPPDGSASVAVSDGISQGSSSEDLPISNGLSYLSMGDEPYTHLQGVTQDDESNRNPPTETLDFISSAMNGDEEPRTIDDDVETSSDDDDILDMPLRRMKAPHAAANINSPSESTAFETIQSPTTATTHPGQGSGDELRFTEDSHEIFHFDENIEHQIQREPEPEPESEPDESENSSRTAEPPENGPQQTVSLSQYSQSPARNILRPGPTHNVSSSSTDVVGSYKGHPFSMPVVSPELHAQAASLGHMNMFVGSVDGRSGFDEGDLQSFMSSLGVGSLSGGTPKSMMHRMMLDDFKEAEAAKDRAPRK
ncbi:uncharacterized protein BP5553_07500 [Venustampulla echinocandica]|uniref:Uncharacterized protein n=1 Tax=Venustampulla echinocandica TaxID=2656787 RepID=A0A370TGP2_9HELO|nr:uncharacterized protein BP5553_07500 [Venustampulla echinocandica]RDL34372.1 hypothetical protein BP5553_07500 [Venustampulla echinocandica]